MSPASSRYKQIAAAFHRQATAYDHHVQVQKRVVAHLAAQVPLLLDGRPAKVLDVGCGTGALLAAIRPLQPQAALFGLDLALNMCRLARSSQSQQAGIVNADAAHVPFRDGVFDLIVSSSVLQWVEELDVCLRELCRVIRPGGFMRLSFFVEGTLGELQECFREAVATCNADDRRLSRLHRFHAPERIARSLGAVTDLECIDVEYETDVDWYESVAALLRSVKGIGAGTASAAPSGGLGWRRIIAETERLYQARYGNAGKVPASYRIVNILARRSVE